MAGMKRNEFKEEIITELSWIMNVMDDLTEKAGLETYETVLIKNRVQMQEEKAINKFFIFHYKELDTLTIEEIQKKISKYFNEATKMEWTLKDDLVNKLINLKREQLEG